GWELETHLNPVEPDFARERDLGDVAALAQTPVGHADTKTERVHCLCLLRMGDRRHSRRRGDRLPEEIPSGHENFRMLFQPLRYSGRLMNGAASGAFVACSFL